MRPFYPKAEEHGIKGEVRPSTLSEILDMVDRKSAGIQDTITSECLGHLTLALSMLQDENTELERQLASKDREIAQLKNRLEQIQRVTEDVDL